MLKYIQFFLFICILFCILLNLPAQEANNSVTEKRTVITRVLGDQYFNIALGLQVPLFIQDPTPLAGESSTSKINLNPGISGGISWAAFLGNNVSLGLDIISGSYSSDPNGKGLFVAAPLTVNINYFFRFFPFELPLHFGLGLNVLSYDENVAFGMILKSGISFYWNTFEDWSFGLNIMYWWTPELYSDKNMSTPPASMTRFGNFLQITLSAMYNL